MPMKFVHTNIAAKDWKRLSQFYITVFDCRVKPPERKYSGDWLDQATGLSRAFLEGVHLVLPGFKEEGPTLEIFTYEKMKDAPDIMANHQGFTHIAFEVDDVHKTLETALKNGGSRLGQVVERKVSGIGTLIFVYFKDPEGNIIEIQSWEKE
ncbi:MAG: VOC family protein [Desulfobacteraceae bacterium]|nr:VOC family protein [Desulfobacteraceae bacterium]